MSQTEVKQQVHEWRELTPSQVALQLAKMSRALEHLSESQEPLERDMVEKKEAYTVEYAKTFIRAEGNNEERKQDTLLKTHDLRLAAELAETLVKMHIQKINTLRKRIDIARSAAALVRAEWELMQVGGRARGG